MENMSFDIARFRLFVHTRVLSIQSSSASKSQQNKTLLEFFYLFAAFVLLFAQVLGPTQRAVPTARVHHPAASEPPLKRNSDHVGLRQRR